MFKPFVLEGPIEQELDYDPHRFFKEECGLAAAIGFEGASAIANRALGMLEHRGEKGTGIASVGSDGRIHVEKSKRPARFAFTRTELEEKLPGRVAIAHGRYGTSGGNSSANIQPLRAENRYGPLVVAHNGNFVNAAPIRESLIEEGANFRSQTDTEVFTALVARSGKETLDDAIIHAATKLEAAFSILVMTPDHTYAIRDRFGIRPLCLASYGEGLLLASEDYAVAQFQGSDLLEEIRPGELVKIDNKTLQVTRRQYAEPDEHFCIFEGFYFGSPFTRHKGVFHEDFRYQAGMELARQNPDIDSTTYDLVIPVLDSGKFSARGFADRSGIRYEEALLRNQRMPLESQGRSFTADNDEERAKILREKFFLRHDKVEGKRVVLVDDSIVRSNTSRLLVQMLRDAGASEVAFMSSAPPIVNICPNGIDFQDKDQLVAAQYDVEQIKETIGASDLRYLDPDLSGLIKRTYDCGMCTGCFGGNYPVNPIGHKRL